jgi:glycogen debranching enzyme
MSNLKKAKEIAERELKACYGKHGIFAGTNHFKDYWARDSFFASLGCLVINDEKIVKKNLELFLDNIKAGQLPLRIGKSSFGVVLSYLGLKSKDSKRKPIYRIDKINAIPKDQNSLFIISLYEYYKKTKDKKILKKKHS